MLTADDLRPFPSFLLLHARPAAGTMAAVTALSAAGGPSGSGSVTDADLALDVAAEVWRTLEVDYQANVDRELVTCTHEVIGGLPVAILHYIERRLPGWLAPGSMVPVIDTANQVVVVGARAGIAALYSSSTAARDALTSSWDPGAAPNVVQTAPLSTEALTSAFIAGPARSLWLAGIHRSTPHKADAKALMGPDLRLALDPLGDQSYALRAARSTLPSPNGTASVLVGVTPRASSVWCAPVTDFASFCARMEMVLEAAGRAVQTGPGAQPARRPFPALAHPSHVGALRDALDVHLVSPTLFANPDALRPGELDEAERWAFATDYVVGQRAGANFDLVIRSGTDRARLRFTAASSGGNRITYQVQAVRNESMSFVRQAVGVCRRRGWLRVQYESGHVVSDGDAYEQRLLDVPFEGWAFAPFPSNDTTRREKPLGVSGSLDPTLIGLTPSLFCWVRNHWHTFGPTTPGAPSPHSGATWLVCDDGSMEVGDFVEVQERSSTEAFVTLLHLKACNREGTTRRISTTDYEIVVAQAQKNLRGLDRMELRDRLLTGIGKAVAVATWRDGQPASRADCVQFLDGCKKVTLRVVVVQPSLTKSELTRLRASPALIAPRYRLQRQQLDTLLLAAEANCRALGATFCVVGHDV